MPEGTARSEPLSPAAWSAWAGQQGLRAVLAALNHLLDQNEAARQRLRLHAGRQLRIEVDSSAWPVPAPPPLDLRISDQGRLEAADQSVAPAVRMILRPSIDAGFDFLRNGVAGMQRHLRIEGDVLLAAAIGELSQRLRWDVEEDISRATGDILAHRLVAIASAAMARASDLRHRAGRAFVRHWVIEDPQVLSRADLQSHRDELASLESRLDELGRRPQVRG